MNEESAKRVNTVLDAAGGPFRNRGSKRYRYDETKWYRALDTLPELDDDERRYVVAFLTRTKRKHEHDAAWLRGTAYSSVAAALAGVLSLDGAWRAVAFGLLVGLLIYIGGKAAESHEPAIGHADALLAALAETSRKAGQD